MISIVIPTYNAENTIHRCVESILNQTFFDWELLLIDDGSRDNSGLMCDGYERIDSRIKSFHKENGGLSSARNYGIEHSDVSSQYICFCDSDDTLDKNFIKDLYEGITNADMSLCMMNDIYEDNYEQMDYHKHNSTFLSDILFNENWYKLWECGVVNSSCNKIYRLDIIRSHNLRFKKIPMLEDIEFNSRYLQFVKNVYYTEMPLYNYWHGSDSLTTKVHEEDYSNYILLHEYLLSWIPEQFHVYIHRFIYHQYFGITLKYIKLSIFDIPNKYLSNNLIKQAINTYTPTCNANKLQHWFIKKGLLRLYRFVFITIYSRINPH